MKEFLYNKNPMLVLSYLSKNMYAENTTTSVSKELGLSLGSVNAILKKFEAMNIVSSRVLGRNIIYDINRNNAILKFFRIFDNITDILPLIKKIENLSQKVILFGSCSKGNDDINSDIDLFILSEEKEKINEIIYETENNRAINPVILNVVEFMELESEDKVFFDEIMKGIILWEV